MTACCVPRDWDQYWYIANDHINYGTNFTVTKAYYVYKDIVPL